MDRKKGVILLVLLISILGIVNAAWILSYSGTIITNVISDEKSYTFTHEFAENLEINTTDSANNITTFWEIDSLVEDLNVTLEMDTHKTNLTSEECSDYKEDCRVILTHIYNNGTEDIRDLLSITDGSGVTGDADFILFAGITNTIEYRVECIRNSCPQEIVSDVDIEEIVNEF